MALRRLRLVPRTALLMTPLGEQVTGQSGTGALAFSGGTYPNLPSGWTILSDRDFTSKTDGGWTDRGDSAFEIVTASGAGGTTVDSMASQTNRLTEYTGRARYNAGFASGNGPISTSYNIASANRKTGLYLRINCAVSSNWYGESSGVNKIYFLPAGSSPAGPLYLSAQGATTGALQFQPRLQNAPANVFGNGSGGTRNLTANTGLGSATITRGTRFAAELIVRMNTCQADGTPNGDGTCEVWVNGTKTHNYTDVCYRGNGTLSNLIPASSLWTEARWNPTWGGNHVGETVPALQYMYMYDAAVGTGT